MRTKLALVGGAMLLILVVIMAQPVPVVRVLRDLLDVKPSVPPNNGDALVYNSASGKWTNGMASGMGFTNTGSGTANIVAKWVGTNSLGDSAFSSVGTNGSLVGDFTANGAAFATTPTVNGSPVLTNAPGFADLVFTNDAGVVHPVDPALTIFAIANNPFSSLVTNGTIDNLYALGREPFSGSDLGDVSGIYSVGESAFQNTVITNSNTIFAFGFSAFNSATISGGSDHLVGIGAYPFYGTTIDGSDHLFAFGEEVFVDAVVNSSSGIYGIGFEAFNSSIIDNSQDIHAYGLTALQQATITNSSDIYVFGEDAGKNMSGDSLSDIYILGRSTGVVGDNISHVFILGSDFDGSIATNNDFIFGDSLYNYKFPGASATFANYISLSGQTNQIADNGSALTYNGVPIGGGGSQVWTNDGGIYPVSPIVLVRPRVDNAENLGTNGLRWLNIWSYGLDVDGDIRVSGDVSPRDVPYIWPVSQGAADTVLVNDGGGILSWSPRTNGLGFYRDQSIEAGAMFPGPTAATFGQYTNLVNDTLSDSFIFADGVTQSARFALTLPDTWDTSTTVKLKLYVTCDNTNAAGITNLVWGVKAGSLAPGEALTNAVFGTQVLTTNGLATQGNVMQVFLTPAITVGGSPATGDSLWFDISRQGTSTSDTWTNTPVRLLKVRCQWLESTTRPTVW